LLVAAAAAPADFGAPAALAAPPAARGVLAAGDFEDAAGPLDLAVAGAAATLPGVTLRSLVSAHSATTTMQVAPSCGLHYDIHCVCGFRSTVTNNR